MATYSNDPENDFHVSGAPLCKAAKSNGERCRNIAKKHQDVCKYHGGSTPQALAAAKQKELETQALKKLQGWTADPDPVDDPISELANMTGQARTLVNMAYRATQPKNACDCCGRDETDPAALMAWVMVSKRAESMLLSMEKLGLSAKIRSIDEQNVMLVLAAMDRAVSLLFPEVDALRIELQDRFREALDDLALNQDQIPETIHTRTQAGEGFFDRPENRTEDIADAALVDDWLGMD